MIRPVSDSSLSGRKAVGDRHNKEDGPDGKGVETDGSRMCKKF